MASTEKIVIEGRPNAQNYGRYFWIADRPGGGFVSVHADRVACDGGHLAFYGRHYKTDDDGLPNYSQGQAGDEQLLLVLPPGQWTAFYAASIIDGSPVAVDRWVERGGEVTA